MVAPTFGTRIRAARLRWGWNAKIQAFMRISGDGPFYIELAPATYTFPASRGRSKVQEKYRIWWEGGRGEELVNGIDCLRGVTKVKIPFTFWIDYNGNFLNKGGQ